jgi:hypothetical protein
MSASEAEKLNVDSIIQRLLEGKVTHKVSRLFILVIFEIRRFNFHLFHLLVRGSRPGKNVQLTEAEIRGLCLKSREIFLSQPILLELEAPLKICGELSLPVGRLSPMIHCV